ncbi:hydrogenase maturation protease [Mycolicibacterium palauense]|uniref:hydrogenase maturation protease n=1 Tax=Mycolicibacterium palauense TaxID=2034511 RepID=UPI001FE5DE84|nr:hydrogenase maturation protease [Mycolicibacterium palauense]
MTALPGHAVLVGVGNRYRRDDGVGPAVAAACAARGLPGVRVCAEPADPTELLEVWTGAPLAVLVDAVVSGAVPGTVTRRAVDELHDAAAVSSHGMDIASMVRLGRALDRLPAELMVITVEAADTGHGAGLTPAVAAAVPDAVRAVCALLGEVTRAGVRPRL